MHKITQHKSTKKELKNLLKKVNRLREYEKVLRQHGQWNYSRYMLGTANGVIEALSLFTGKQAEYLNAPNVFLRDTEWKPDCLLNK